MIRVVALYPRSAGQHFDFDYYMNRHIPMLRRLGEGGGLRDVQVCKGLSMLGSDAPAEHVCVCLLDFDSQEAITAYLGAHGAQVLGDIPNYTDIQPVIQVTEVRG